MGTLSYAGISGTSLTLRYAPAEAESSAVLHRIDRGTGTETTQSLTAGNNSVTVTPGTAYLFVSSAYDGGGDFLAFGNFLLLRIPSEGAGDDFEIRWRTDYDEEWDGAAFASGEQRIRIPTNRRGHWLQWEIYGDNQNQRLELRNIGLEMRMSGPSYEARQT